MKISTKIEYKCDFCDCIDHSKIDIQEHENACVYNPKNKACETCGWISRYINGCGCKCGLGGNKTDCGNYSNIGIIIKWTSPEDVNKILDFVKEL